MEIKTIKMLIRSLSTYIPILNAFLPKLNTWGTNNARYCYSVWLRHLVLAGENNLNTKPKIIAELGPGDSLGIGLCALLTGAEKYYALDVYEYADLEINLTIFDELVKMFKNREDIPNSKEFPRIEPTLTCYKFPKHILSDEYLRSQLSDKRINLIRESIINCKTENRMLSYIVPWDVETLHKSAEIQNSVDMIFSQAVLEHVTKIDDAYKSMHKWLKPGGVMSHAIDFKSHGFSKYWNGHWAYSNSFWKFLFRKKESHFLNRKPLSYHIQMHKQIDFEIKYLHKYYSNDLALKRNQLNKEFVETLSNEDLTTASVFIQSQKRK